MSLSKKIKLSIQGWILIGMIMGPIIGLTLSIAGYSEFSTNWIKPFGEIFIRLLKLLAMPLVLVSVVSAIASFQNDPQNLTKKGLKTIVLYLVTTVLAVAIGLVIANITKPGNTISTEIKETLRKKYDATAKEKTSTAKKVNERGPLTPIVDMFSSNIFESLVDTRNMLQVIVFAFILGISIILTDSKHTDPIKNLFHSLNEVFIKMVDVVMKLAPIGVFALLASLVTDIAGNNPVLALEILASLAYYAISVLIGLFIMLLIVYPIMIKVGAGYSPLKFLKGMLPAQLTAFYTSSSAATLSMNMKCVKENLKVSEKTANTVLPLGATVNMDGTSLYQAVAALFIAQAYNIDLTLAQQLSILLTATLSSIGAAAVPGAGMVMLVIVLEQSNVPTEGIALIFGVDRILDMFRTAVNVTSDAAVAILVDKEDMPEEYKK